MPRVDFSAARKQAEEEGQISGGGFFKVKEGDNRIRLLSECLPHTSTFKNGDKSFKWLCYVLDRKDGEVKPFFMAHTIYKMVEALQASEDYAFEEVPMPYDITIKAKGAGTKEVEYALLPARLSSALSSYEVEKLERQKPLAELKKLLSDKQDGNGNGSRNQPPAHGDEDGPVPF